jgi:enediyne biosynthesis protein E4
MVGGEVNRTALAGFALLSLFAAAPTVTIRFADRARQAGTDFVLQNGAEGKRYQIETMLGGLAVLDFDGDGNLDIYFVNGAPIPSLAKNGAGFHNRLLRNNGDGTFTDATAKAGVAGDGYGMGVGVGDYDNDGDADIYVAGVNRNHLYRNEGSGVFTDVTEASGATGVHPRLGKKFAIGAGWFDFDNDGDLDLFVLQYVDWSAATEKPCYSYQVRAYCHPDNYAPLPNLLYRNNGDGTFTDVTDESGIGKALGKGMGVAFADYDGDGRMDIFVSNDSSRNFLFRNRGGGVFSEVGVLAGVAYNEQGKTIAGMGTDFRDIDGDGRPDIVQTGMIGDTFPFFRNVGGQFQDLTAKSGLAALSYRLTAWGLGAVDFDNDGHKDLFTANASILDNAREVENLPDALPPSIFRNLGTRFVDVSKSAGASFLAARVHRGAAFGDFNNDGKIDIVVNALNQPAKLLMNTTSSAGEWLQFDLQGVSSNRDGIGAAIAVTAGGRTLYNHATTSVGYNSSSDRRVHFGLGRAKTASRVEIRWPSGRTQILENVAAGQILKVKEP